MKQLIENEDYYVLPDGRLVFTGSYLQERGFCCGNGCLHCPSDYMNVAEPYRSRLLQKRQQDEKETD